MTSFYWKVDRKYPEKKELSLIRTQDHPLKNFVVTERFPRKLSRSQTNNDSTDSLLSNQKSIEEVKEIIDPLTELALRDMDPLSRMQKNTEIQSPPLNENSCSPIQIWNNRKTAILNKYTTSSKISIVSSYLPEGDKIVVKNQNTMVDKVQNRLEQLDWCEESSQKKMELTQTEYITKIDMLNKELVSAWNSEQRVKAVKIAIQCAKLLADTNVMSFYPSKFVLITEILDIFGHFVYDRLKHMAIKSDHDHEGVLPARFTPDMVSDVAKETCLNWFYKIASIRELVPRLYVELAIIRSYSFISTTEDGEALHRITKMINGIGNPLVAVYARCYLCKVGLTLSSRINDSYIMDNLQYFMITYNHLFSQGVKTTMRREEVSLHKYLDLYTPAVNFIMEILVAKTSDNVMNEILSQCIQMQGKCSLVVNAMISVFKPCYVAEKTVEFLEMIGQSAEEGYPVSSLLCSLGNSLGQYPPPSEQRKPILRYVGKYSSHFKDLDEYICYVEAWMPFIVKNFKVREINTMLGDVISHVSGRKDCDNYINQLKNIMKIIIQDTDDFESLFTMANFLRFLDLFQQDSIKVEVCKMILTCLNNDIKISDPIITSALSFLCNILHDSVDALTPEDELRQIGLIICNIIRKIDYGRDFEQQLNFYVEARGCFSNIDSVLIELVQKTNTLMVKTRDVVKGYHSRKTADFVRACAAYCFITIPSISSNKARLELYLLSSQVALYNQCYGQAEASFKAALASIPEYQDDSLKDEIFLVLYIKKFLSTLLVVPDNPEFGVLSLFRSLLNILKQYEWENETSLVTIYLSVLDVLSVMSYETLPYHVDKVESNDVLYGGDEKFIHEINKICTVVLVEILTCLKQMGSSKKQSALALDLFIHIMNRCDLADTAVQKLALNLWQKCSKHGFIERKHMENIRDYYKSKCLLVKDKSMQKFVEILHSIL